ncbi:siroheme synthase CysG [Aureimonas jatrophae]|uniref:Uroporphyrin-III C-methyltransferase / precorrin-2 dehydrogenase / sirohydrochlorin ferrochelatase n=1 Tax=Aureimonas jatrophae TaxID=1166073 RepID=A0A1H0EUS8_9HYPH|nr:siroheme synthase CysG [Aureimonas jatrophae]MBB3950304.1 uroporphyrin-III C-methyltransferase/precorrin-2 dehydrogenase/sirohydrochlorin ferrochelatase [Aureimonas jatrophae]SDN86105.1 uroporphyrin-III C-methyltransferase / precorrin-2 dehydrogenase / sirohydrochlorin ferrochelatase [Aureimonas jatrophae]
MKSVSQPSGLAETSRQRPQRMGDLATLPVFFDLKGQRVVMSGGSDAAAWKAELLAASGALVDLYGPADEIGEEMRTVLALPFPDGRIRHHDRSWSLDVFAGAALAVADCESDSEAQAFFCAARAAGVPVNVIDKPRFCQFRFGTIVNRSPVVVGISTDGAAPILGQAIRRRIETLLPATLTGWARMAARVRAEVMDRLAPGPARRTFWERFSDDAFTRRLPDAEAEADARRFVQDLANRPQAGGRVTLVGAGPGDAELLTLKAVRALQAADVILFDDLVSDDILELARREAKRMLVGKRAARESCRQEDINRLMVQFAQAGKHVVRLKSGDVSVFGRSGEEIAELRAKGIPVAIVPGITAASALAAGFGVSLTHRDRAQSVRFVTGHSQKGDLPEQTDWRALADDHATTIFYMGGRMAPRIAAELMAHGLPPETPVAVAASISRPDETRAVGRLDELGAIVARIGVDRPILIGVGRVFGDVEAAALVGHGEIDRGEAPSSRLSDRAAG